MIFLAQLAGLLPRVPYGAWGIADCWRCRYGQRLPEQQQSALWEVYLGGGHMWLSDWFSGN